MSDINPPDQLEVPVALKTIDTGETQEYMQQKDWILFQMAQRLQEQFSTTKIIRSSRDLPPAINGTHQLEDFTVYSWQGNIDLGANTITVGANSPIVGRSAATDVMSSTSSDFLINGIGIRVLNLRVSIPNGFIFNQVTATRAPLFVFNFVCRALQGMGQAGSGSGVIFEKIRITPAILGWTGLTMIGDTVDNSVINCRFIGYGGTCIDFGANIFSQIAITLNTFNGVAGSVALSGLPDSANITNLALVSQNKFIGDGVPLSGITKKDVRWDFNNNLGVASSQKIGSLCWSGSATINDNIIDGAYVPLKLSGVTADDNIEQFSLTDAAAAVLTFDGIDTFSGTIFNNFNAEPSTASNVDYRVACSINGAIPDFATAPYMPLKFKGNEESIGTLFDITLEPGDTVQLMVAGDGTSNDVTFGFGQQTTR